MNRILIRIFDLLFAAIGLLVLIPFFFLISILIALESRGGIIFKQARIGKNGREFRLLKFRTMYSDSQNMGLITVGTRDPRITRAGYFLRRNKLDELPQLFNVLCGDMSIVGPRPEVRKYVEMYSIEQMKILSVKPGITDYASIQFANESEILGNSEDPENFYITQIMPEKIRLNLIFMERNNLFHYFQIIIRTILKIILRK
jgi:lipopolysaccharide/colanic/teichoic acid biosynthesis glycosyltransferase